MSNIPTMTTPNGDMMAEDIARLREWAELARTAANSVTADDDTVTQALGRTCGEDADTYERIIAVLERVQRNDATTAAQPFAPPVALGEDGE